MLAFWDNFSRVWLLRFGSQVLLGFSKLGNKQEKDTWSVTILLRCLRGMVAGGWIFVTKLFDRFLSLSLSLSRTCQMLQILAFLQIHACAQLITFIFFPQIIDNVHQYVKPRVSNIK